MYTKFLHFAMVLLMLAIVGVFAWQFSGFFYEGHGAATAQATTACGAMAILATIVCVDCGRQKYFRSSNRVKEMFASRGYEIGDFDAFGRTASTKRTNKPERREAKRLAKSRHVSARSSMPIITVAQRRVIQTMIEFGLRLDQLVSYVSVRHGEPERKRRYGRHIRKDASGRITIELVARDGRTRFRVRRQEHLVFTGKEDLNSCTPSERAVAA